MTEHSYSSFAFGAFWNFFFSQVFSIRSFLNPERWNPWIYRADCSLFLPVVLLLFLLTATLWSSFHISTCFFPRSFWGQQVSHSVCVSLASHLPCIFGWFSGFCRYRSLDVLLMSLRWILAVEFLELPSFSLLLDVAFISILSSLRSGLTSLGWYLPH